MKITKSELKEMIREALREELNLKESSDGATQNALESTINKALSAARRGIARDILVISSPGTATHAKIRECIKANGYEATMISARSDFENIGLDAAGKVLIVDEYNRATPRSKAKLFSIIFEQAMDQLFTIAVFNDNGGYIDEAERSKFNYVIDVRN
jgi:hypothetical protein